MGAACAWQTPGGWTGRRFRLGLNKGVFDAEVCAIYQAHCTLDQRQESGHRYIVFVNSAAAAMDRTRTDAQGPGQRFAIATIGVCSRILERDNNLTIRWVPAHYGVAGNEKADGHAKAAAEEASPRDNLTDETSLAHMSRANTETKTRATGEWIRSHVKPERKYMPPWGEGSGLRKYSTSASPWPVATTSCCLAMQ